MAGSKHFLLMVKTWKSQNGELRHALRATRAKQDSEIQMSTPESPMIIALLKAVAAFVPVGLLLAGSALLLLHQKRLSALLQLGGALALAVVVIAHIFEALQLLPWMGWGEQESVGHYVDLTGAMLGMVLFPIGYFLQVVTQVRDKQL